MPIINYIQIDGRGKERLSDQEDKEDCELPEDTEGLFYLFLYPQGLCAA